MSELRGVQLELVRLLREPLAAAQMQEIGDALCRVRMTAESLDREARDEQAAGAQAVRGLTLR